MNPGPHLTHIFHNSIQHPVACVTEVTINTVYGTLFMYYREYTYDFTKIIIRTTEPCAHSELII
jgi:hypothetical protein